MKYLYVLNTLVSIILLNSCSVGKYPTSTELITSPIHIRNVMVLNVDNKLEGYYKGKIYTSFKKLSSDVSYSTKFLVKASKNTKFSHLKGILNVQKSLILFFIDKRAIKGYKFFYLSSLRDKAERAHFATLDSNGKILSHIKCPVPSNTYVVIIPDSINVERFFAGIDKILAKNKTPINQFFLKITN